MQDILLCTDLDRTLIPNGPHPESQRARPLLRALAARPEIHIAYVSGRHRELIQLAIHEYALPEPDFVLADVGSTLYSVRDAQWQSWSGWAERIASDWNGLSHAELADLLNDIPALAAQPREKQNRFKLSYFVEQIEQKQSLLSAISQRLADTGVRAQLVWSVDDLTQIGLLDILPIQAGKLEAIRFLLQKTKISSERTVFAGDSGNDLPVLTSEIQSVLVANATEELREEAVRLAENEGCLASLHLAKGTLLGMNGNYAAGILEGLVHFIPGIRPWLTEQLKTVA